MGYLTFFCLFLCLVIKPCEVSSITTRIDHNQRVRNFRRHTGPPPFTDWELGLRESVHQALLREHYTEPTLREQLLEAPFLGRQDQATPFGDIAVLARGQLYVTADGFKFLQDSEQDGCSDCRHNPRCAGSPQCQLWTSLGHHHKLLALWTVKRIRHRDPHYGHVFEIEYTISPITSAINEELVGRNGYFNYNVPGHIFVIRSNPRASSTYYLSGDKWYKNQPAVEEHTEKETGSGHFKPGILIGVGPDGYKQVLHSFPGFYSSYHPQNHNDQTTIDPKEYELYKKLIESLASKTSNVPHRFSPTDKTTAATKPTYHLTSFVPQTTFVQFTDGQLVPLTENALPPTTEKLPPTVNFPTTVPTKVTKYSEPDLFYHTLQTTTQVPTPPKPITMPVTTIHYYTPVEVSSSTATTSPKVIVTTSKPTRKTTHNIDDFDIFTTKPLKKTTRFTSTKVTVPLTTLPEQQELLPVTSTEPMQPVTETPVRTSLVESEQLAPPEKVETTVPYFSSTVTQPSVVKTESVPPTTPKFSTFGPLTREEATTVIEKIPYTEQRTTVILPSTTQDKSTKGTTVVDKIYTVMATNPTTLREPTTILNGREPTTILNGREPSTILTERVPTIFDHGTTPVFTVYAETVPSTHSTTQRTTPFTHPTTIFEYTFDTTTKGHIPSSTNTLPPTSHFPSTIVTIPTTTSHYYYFESEPSTITTEGTTFVQSTQTDRPTTAIRETTYNEQVTSISTPQPVKTTTRRIPKVSSTTPDDFLLSPDNDKPNKITDSKKDFNEDDIFGTPVVEITTVLPQTTTKRVFQSDLSKALFGGRRSKQVKHSSKITKRPVSNSTKIIYNNFYAPSTRKKYETTTEIRPSTEQSYSTSISVEVNKKDSNFLQLEPTVKADVQEIKNTDYKIYKAELPKDSVKTTTEKIAETKKAFDDIALQLVNHARSIDYLDRKPSRQPKYKRRSYTTRRKSLRRVNINEDKNKET